MEIDESVSINLVMKLNFIKFSLCGPNTDYLRSLISEKILQLFNTDICKYGDIFRGIILFYLFFLWGHHSRL